ncbi:MAG: plastocyanin/azurin family copper-binding protein, partial [Gammaproteobacteria bacterium]
LEGMAAGAALVEELGAGPVGLVDLDLPAAASYGEGKGEGGAESDADKPGAVEGGHGPGILSAAVRAPAAILFICAAMLAGGCSDDDQPVRTVSVRPGATVEMKAEEYRFDPGRVAVRADGLEARQQIVLANRGSLAHNIHIRDGERTLAKTPSFRPGEERSVRLGLPPGTYDFLCTVADHEEKGMVGKLEVR